MPSHNTLPFGRNPMLFIGTTNGAGTTNGLCQKVKVLYLASTASRMHPLLVRMLHEKEHCPVAIIKQLAACTMQWTPHLTATGGTRLQNHAELTHMDADQQANIRPR